jgi:hypothetical protein
MEPNHQPYSALSSCSICWRAAESRQLRSSAEREGEHEVDGAQPGAATNRLRKSAATRPPSGDSRHERGPKFAGLAVARLIPRLQGANRPCSGTLHGAGAEGPGGMNAMSEASPMSVTRSRTHRCVSPACVKGASGSHPGQGELARGPLGGPGRCTWRQSEVGQDAVDDVPASPWRPPAARRRPPPPGGPQQTRSPGTDAEPLLLWRAGCSPLPRVQRLPGGPTARGAPPRPGCGEQRQAATHREGGSCRPRRADQQHVLPLHNEGKGHEGDDLWLRDAPLEVEVEVLEGLRVLEVGAWRGRARLIPDLPGDLRSAGAGPAHPWRRVGCPPPCPRESRLFTRTGVSGSASVE